MCVHIFRFAWPLFFDFVSAGPLSKALAKELELEEAPDLVSALVARFRA